MLAELARVLRPSGVLLACREHVVDNYGDSLRAFLESQVDHQLYGGENAFTLPDYRASIRSCGLDILVELGPTTRSSTPFQIRPKCYAKRSSQRDQGAYCAECCLMTSWRISVFGLPRVKKSLARITAFWRPNLRKVRQC